MRAVGFYEYGNADVLQVLDLPAVNAGEGEVRVRVHAAAINPTDILFLDLELEKTNGENGYVCK